MKVWTSLALAVLGLAWAALPAAAQGRGLQRPTVSPYLNLTRRDGSAGVNYYNLVRPEIAFRGAINQLQERVTTNQEALTDIQSGGAASLPPTGHAAGFQTHGRYFLNIGSARPTGARPVAAAPARPASRSGR